MINDLQISNMQVSDINEAKEIWIKQYEKYCNDDSFTTYWVNNTETIEKFLNFKIKNQQAIVAKKDEKVLGFLAYDEFPFNGEKSIFCPIVGHAAIEEYKESIYLQLYKNISKDWVKRGIFNHMWTIFFNDETLKNVLFNLGYGSYLIDAFNKCDVESNKKSVYSVRETTIDDVEIVYELVEESRQYYASAPLFLRRDEFKKDEIKEFIVKNKVFIASDNETPVGFLNLSISENNDFINMSIKECGLIDEIGAYIKKEYRNKNIGINLLKAANDYCRKANVPYMHVDFETANLYGDKFWRKYFKPMLISVRRTINKDINNI